MSDVDPETKIGTCSQCGSDTQAYKGGMRGTGRWRCRNRVRAQPSVQARPKVSELAPDRRDVMRVRKMRGNGSDITLEQWTQLKAEANGRCQLCAREAVLHVDHCHDTGKVRGLLCSTCNTGLGKFGDSIERLERALDYLRRAGCHTLR